MAVISMQLTSLLKRIARDNPDISFTPGETFSWNHAAKEIIYDPTHQSPAQLLHELAHALLGHQTYQRDIQLVGMERDTWEYARTTLGPQYKVVISDEIIQLSLDSYRDWLHARSTCPQCDATGIEQRKQQYLCPACAYTWRVNEARTCGLKRYATK